ncbi:MAG: FkbM family methyltransferase [Nitrososphaeraceae archaeon]
MKETVRWLLSGAEAVTIFDKCIFFIVKVVYLGLRTSLRITLGKERRDQLCMKHDLDFGTLWYKFYNILKLSNEPLLKLKMPKYNFQFYCRNNKDDFTTMTMREDEIIRHFNTKQGDIVVDVGAHIGKYTIIASKRVGENGKVIAIEAHPGNYEMLNRNIKLNGLTNVTPLNYAVYSRKTKVKIYNNYTIMSERIREKKVKEKFVEVNADTLDNLLQQNGIRQEQVNWIKIDVEGAEYEVLKGACNTLSNSKDIALYIEIHGQNNYQPIIELLNSHSINVTFQKNYDDGDLHLIARR